MWGQLEEVLKFLSDWYVAQTDIFGVACREAIVEFLACVKIGVSIGSIELKISVGKVV